MNQTGTMRSFLHSRLLFFLSVPAIYSVLVPALLLDLLATLYMHICFPIYGIGLVRRSDYFIFDRHKERFLSGLEKINCEYCAYFNGLLSYLTEIAARTEQYWCPLRHKHSPPRVHRRYAKFAPYENPDLYHRQLEDLRRQLADAEQRK